jgi:hypothetical protein
VTIERSRSQVVVRGTVDDPRGLRVQRTIRSRVGVAITAEEVK